MKKIDFSKKKKKISKYLAILFGVIFIWYGYSCFIEKVCKVEMIEKFIRNDLIINTPNGVIIAEVVDTKSSRELGLSGRSRMRDNEGMLFVFDLPGRYGFWMKDMLFPIDIIWINQNGVVVHIEQNVKPESYPKAFINGPEAYYVLEINSGMTEKNGIFLGSKVKLK